MKLKTSRRLHDVGVSMALLVLLAVTWGIYQPAIPGFFMLDDYDNLSALEGGVVDTTSLRNYLKTGNAGPTGRPLAKLTFLVNDNAWPSDPAGFKRFNLLLHLLAGLAVFVVCRLLLRTRETSASADWLALAATALWLVHPLQVSTVMYVVQRMTQLSTLFVLMGVASHLYLRSRGDSSIPTRLAWITLSLLLFTLLATFSKESGVLLPVYLLVIEFTLLANRQNAAPFLWWRRIFLILPTLSLIAYLSYIPRWIESYAAREFTLVERVLTQPVVLFDYLSTLVTMKVSGLGLFQDDYPLYSTLLDPMAATVLATLLIAAILAIAYRRQFPLASFGVLWFLAGHMLESSTIALEIYFEHRNYLPAVGPILALVIGGYTGFNRISTDLAKTAPVMGFLLVCIAAMITYGYASEWGSRMRLLPIWAAEHPESPRAQRTYAQLLASNGLPEVALDELDEAYKRFPYDLSIPIMSIDISCAFNKPLRYNLKDLAKSADDHRWTDGLRPALQSLYSRILDTPCRDKTDQIHEITASLPELQKGEHRRSGIASFFVLDGDLYLKEGNAHGALRSYQIVNQLVPSADSALRIANLFILTGNYDEAKEALKVAEARESEGRHWYQSSRSDVYAEKFLLIEQLASKPKARKVIRLKDQNE